MIKVIWYEVGREESNVLGSGSIYYVNWAGKNEEDALEELGKSNNNYISRLIREDKQLKEQKYNLITKEWEYW